MEINEKLREAYQKALECSELLGGQRLRHGLAIEVNAERVRHL